MSRLTALPARKTAGEPAMKMHVPLLDLKAQYASIKDEVLAAVAEVLESQCCIAGPKVAELEEKIAEILPNANVDFDVDGQIVVYTNLTENDIGKELVDIDAEVD